MSKARVLSLVKKQGATVEVLDPYSNGELEVCVMLPEGMIWDNRTDSGVIVITREYDQSLAEFWEDVFSEINYPVIKAGA